MSAEPEKLGVIYNPKAGTRKVQKRSRDLSKNTWTAKVCLTTMCSPKGSVR